MKHDLEILVSLSVQHQGSFRICSSIQSFSSIPFEKTSSSRWFFPCFKQTKPKAIQPSQRNWFLEKTQSSMVSCSVSIWFVDKAIAGHAPTPSLSPPAAHWLVCCAKKKKPFQNEQTAIEKAIDLSLVSGMFWLVSGWKSGWRTACCVVVWREQACSLRDNDGICPIQCCPEQTRTANRNVHLQMELAVSCCFLENGSAFFSDWRVSFLELWVLCWSTRWLFVRLFCAKTRFVWLFVG